VGESVPTTPDGTGVAAAAGESVVEDGTSLEPVGTLTVEEGAGLPVAGPPPPAPLGDDDGTPVVVPPAVGAGLAVPFAAPPGAPEGASLLVKFADDDDDDGAGLAVSLLLGAITEGAPVEFAAGDGAGLADPFPAAPGSEDGADGKGVMVEEGAGLSVPLLPPVVTVLLGTAEKDGAALDGFGLCPDATCCRRAPAAKKSTISGTLARSLRCILLLPMAHRAALMPQLLPKKQS
jgi:hypothetical protein